MPNPRSLALFDFDHTITTADTYAGFLRRVATPVQQARARWTVGPWLAGYRLGLVSAAALRTRVTRLVFAGRDADDIARQAEHYARDALPSVLRPDILQRIAWHQAQGHTVAVVSGSLDLYLRPWCTQHGLHVICNRLEVRDGRLTGRYRHGDCGPRKAALIRMQYDLSAYRRIYAYGDSREDRPMLALAHERWYRGRRTA